MGIYEKIFNLQVTLDGMEWYKDGTNDYSKYKYISEYVYKSNWREALIENRLLFNMSEIDRVIKYASETGANQHHTVVFFEGTLIDIDSGEIASYTFSGEGSDALDKGGAKSYTQGLKSFIASNFSISGDANDENNPGNSVIENIQATPKELNDLKQSLADMRALVSTTKDDDIKKDVATFIKDLSEESDRFIRLKADRLKEINKTIKTLNTKINNILREEK